MQRLSNHLRRNGRLATCVGVVGAVVVSRATTTTEKEHSKSETNDKHQRSDHGYFRYKHHQDRGHVTMSEPASFPWSSFSQDDPKSNKTGGRKRETFNENLKRRRTLQRMKTNSTKAPLESKYTWRKEEVLGEGAYGSVYYAIDKSNNEPVALKRISKQFTDDVNFQQEMNAMLYIRSKGGHPHLCSLHEYFENEDSYFVILDYIGGGEMFDHLIGK